MGIEITMSPDGHILIPQDVRDALGFKPGDPLSLHCVGGQLMVESSRPVRPPAGKITYEEFRRRVPKYEGPLVAIEDMTVDFSRLSDRRDDDMS